jgi:Mg2+ and Co2+ transporter CorA
MRVFKEQTIKQLFVFTDKKIYREIEGLSEHRLLNTELVELANEIAEKYKINTTLNLSTENVTNEIKMEPVPNMNKYYTASVRYSFPVKGNVELFKYQPLKQSRIGEIRGELVNNSILTVIIKTRWSTPELDETTEESVKAQIKNQIEDIQSNIERVKEEAQVYNDSISAAVLNIITDKKAEIVAKNKRHDRLNPFR